MTTRHEPEEIDFVEAPYNKVARQGDILFYSTLDMTHQDWLNFRANGIGGSDVGTVLMLNPYCSRLQLYEQKVGLLKYEPEENSAMFWGKELEEIIADKWQYFDGTEEGMIKNVREDKVIRKCSRVNAYAINQNYPWLFASLDRRINKNQASPFTGLIHPKSGVLEVKTISGYTSAMWEAGIPPYHVVQLQTYLLVYGVDYGEIAVLRDGRNFEVIPFERNEAICDRILTETEAFWNKVTKGRQLVAEREAAMSSGSISMANGFQAQLDLNEPEPDGTEAYSDYMKEKFKNPIDSVIMGGLEQLTLCRNLADARAREKAVKEEKLAYENPIKNYMGNNQTMDFGESGKASWAADKNGKRTLRLNLI
jgi:putative phage-type endonuclease